MFLTFVVAALVFAFHQRMLHRNAQVRRFRDRATATYLARAGIDLVKFALREARTRGAGEPGVDLNSGPLLHVLLAEASTLQQVLGTRIEADEDHSDLLRRLLGPQSLDPLDALLARFPGARVLLRVRVVVEPASPQRMVRDPVLKTVQMTVESEARLGTIREVFTFEEPIWVYNLLPKGASRFTLALGDNSASWIHAMLGDGNHEGGDFPICLFHRPEDGDPLAPAALEPGPLPISPTIEGPDEITSLIPGRGLVYLSERTPPLPVASALGPFGEGHLLGRIGSASDIDVWMQDHPAPPGSLSSLRGRDPRSPQIEQAGGIRTSVTGYSPTLNQAMGPPSELVLSQSVPRLKLMGTPSMPSGTVVVGGGDRQVQEWNRLDIDRDASDQDEQEQRALTGLSLPTYDGRGGWLLPVDAGTYGEKLAQEAGSDAQGRRLGMTDLSPPSGLTNINAWYDGDGDGTRDTRVSSETGHDPIFVDPVAFTYGAVFGDHSAFSPFASGPRTLPSLALLEVAGLDPERARARLIDLVRSPDAVLQQYRITRLTVPFTDSLHPQLGESAMDPYLDTQDQDFESLGRTIREGIAIRHPGDAPVVIRGQDLFESVYLTGGQLDLEGRLVRVLPLDVPDPPDLLIFEAPIIVKPGSGGILEVDRLELPALINSGDAGGYGPLVVRVRELVLTGDGPFEACFAADQVVYDRGSPPEPSAPLRPTLIRGSLVVSTLPRAPAGPIMIQWDPRNDPTGIRAPLYYRYDCPQRSGRIYQHLDLALVGMAP